MKVGGCNEVTLGGAGTGVGNNAGASGGIGASSNDGTSMSSAPAGVLPIASSVLYSRTSGLECIPKFGSISLFNIEVSGFPKISLIKVDNVYKALAIN